MTSSIVTRPAVTKATVPNSLNLEVADPFGLKTKLADLLAHPSRNGADSLYNFLNSIGDSEAARVTVLRRLFPEKDLERVTTSLLARYGKIKEEAAALIEKIVRSEPVDMRVRLLLNLEKRFWGPIGDRELTDDAGVSPENLKAHQQYFRTYCEYRDSMEAITAACQTLWATWQCGVPHRQLPESSPLMKAISKTQRQQEPYVRLLSKAERLNVARDAMQGKQPGDFIDTLQYLTYRRAGLKKIMAEVLEEPEMQEAAKGLEAKLGRHVRAISKYVSQLKGQLSEEAELRAQVWISLTSRVGRFGTSRNRCADGLCVPAVLKPKLEGVVNAYLEYQKPVENAYADLLAFNLAREFGDCFSSEGNVRQQVAKKWPEKKLLAALLSEDEKMLFCRREIEALIKDDTYESAEKLREFLDLIAPTEKERRAFMGKMFSSEQRDKLLAVLEDNVIRCAASAKGLESYLKEVHGRLSAFENLCGGRDTWAFVHGVDHEDLIDERNAGRDIGARNAAANAAKIYFEAMYGMFTFGTSWPADNADERLSTVNKLW